MRSRIVVVAGTVLVLGAAVMVVFALIETDEERIERLVEDMRVAAVGRDVEGVLEGVAEDVDYPGGRERLGRRIENILRTHPPEGISAEVLMIEIDGDRAEADVEVWYRTKAFGGRPYRTRIRVVFGRRDIRWRVVGLSGVGG